MMEYALDDDLPEEFKCGTLEINNEDRNASNEYTTKHQNQKNLFEKSNTDNVNNNVNTWKDNLLSPLSQITKSLWNNNKEKISDEKLIQQNANNFFTFREEIVDKAVKESIEKFVDIENDGPLINCFLLTEINLWDTEKERLILLTKKTLITIKYDFIALRALDFKKVPLKHIDTIVIGDLVYPNGSLIPNRNVKGVRIMWNKGAPINFTTRWNPFANEVPLWTFTSHPLLFNKYCVNDNQRKLYDIQEFIERLFEVSNLLRRDQESLIHHKNIVVENYIGLGSVVHNKNALGFFKVRGKFSF